MLTEYVQAALKKAKYEILQDDDSYYGEIPGFKGVYANAATLEECRNELREVLEDWILLSISRHLPLPIVDGIELKMMYRQFRSIPGRPKLIAGELHTSDDFDLCYQCGFDYFKGLFVSSRKNWQPAKMLTSTETSKRPGLPTLSPGWGEVWSGGRH